MDLVRSTGTIRATADVAPRFAPSCHTVTLLTGSIGRDMHGIVYANKIVECVQSHRFFCTFVCFLIRNVLNIEPIPVCHISKERDDIYNQLFIVTIYINIIP